MDKIKLILESLLKAYRKFEETKNYPVDDAHRESTIQRFEYTLELCIKLMHAIISYENADKTIGMRSTIRDAHKLGLINRIDLWFDFAEGRNKTSHLYHDTVAIDIFNLVSKNFSAEVADFIKRVELKINELDLK